MEKSKGHILNMVVQAVPKSADHVFTDVVHHEFGSVHPDTLEEKDEKDGNRQHHKQGYILVDEDVVHNRF